LGDELEGVRPLDGLVLLDGQLKDGLGVPFSRKALWHVLTTVPQTLVAFFQHLRD
jgi:hypothetical protein